MAKRLYLIGIDAAPLWLIKELSKEKGVEAFKELIEGKNIVEMESTLPPMTGAAWPSIYTGLEPAEHGVPDFFEMKEDYTPELVYYDSREHPPFWKKLARIGLRCLIVTPATDINLPNYPNVDMITGFPLKAKTNNGYLASLMKKYNFYGEPDIEKDMKDGRMSEGEAVKHFVKSIESRSKITEEAMERKDYDFVYLCFTETDRLQHFVMNKKDRNSYLLPLYRAINAHLEHLILKVKREDDSAIIIVSDHGSQPIKEKFLINGWLIKNGYARLKDSVVRNIVGSKADSSVSYTIREKLLKTKLRGAYDKLPHAAKGAVSRSLGRFFSSASGGDYTRLHLFDLDMRNTEVFAAISNLNVSTIWINDKRFEKGTVKGGLKQKLKKEITRKLMSVKNKHGKNVIKGVYDGDGYYKGRGGFIAPDLFADAIEGYSIDIFNFSPDTVFMDPEPPKRGDHTMMGIFGMYPKLPPSNGKGFSVLGVAPVILKYYGLR